MVVRFLPAPAQPSPPDGADRRDLAEVIELRSKLQQRGWGVRDDASPSEAEPASVSGTEGSHDQRSEASELERPVREEAVRLLSRRARSSGELRQDLLRLDYDPSDVEDVIDEFERNLYLDDVGLARFLTDKLRSTKKASKSQIRVKLRERKLAEAAIERALAELDDDEELALLRQVASDRARTLRDVDRQTAERRLLGFLSRRGWSGERATRAVRDALDEQGTNLSRRSGGVRFQ